MRLERPGVAVRCDRWQSSSTTRSSTCPIARPRPSGWPRCSVSIRRRRSGRSSPSTSPTTSSSTSPTTTRRDPIDALRLPHQRGRVRRGLRSHPRAQRRSLGRPVALATGRDQPQRRRPRRVLHRARRPLPRGDHPPLRRLSQRTAQHAAERPVVGGVALPQPVGRPTVGRQRRAAAAVRRAGSARRRRRARWRLASAASASPSSAPMPVVDGREQLAAAGGDGVEVPQPCRDATGSSPVSGPRTTIVPGPAVARRGWPGRSQVSGRSSPRRALAIAVRNPRRAASCATRRDDGDEPPRPVPGIAGRPPADVLGAPCARSADRAARSRRRRPPARRRRASARSPCASSRGRCRTARRGAPARVAARRGAGRPSSTDSTSDLALSGRMPRRSTPRTIPLQDLIVAIVQMYDRR